jgi:Rrf2 family protein
MRLTTKSRYGTRLILDITIHGKEKPVPLSDVSKRQNISLKYLEQLTRKLKKANILNTHRGPFGGHTLGKPPENITIGEIVRILEESTAITVCAEQGDKACSTCSRAGDCLSRYVWVEASKAMFDRLDAITIGSLLKKINL